MKVKFNLFERVAGIFVLAAFAGSIAVTVSIAYKKGWFSPQIPVFAIFPSANGIHIGTKVQMAGLRAGSVTSVELQADNQIKVKLVLLEKFFKKTRDDSVIRVVRPFIIGEKILEVTVGGLSAAPIASGHLVRVEKTLDVMDIMSSGNLGTYLESFGQLTDNLKILLEAFSDKKRFQALIEVLDEINPFIKNMSQMSLEVRGLLKQMSKDRLIKNMNKMSLEVKNLSRQMTTDRRIGRTLNNFAIMTDEFNKHLPQISANAPNIAKTLIVALENLTLLSEGLKQVIPALTAVAPDLPRAGKRMIEVIDELVITLKAMQKTFFIRGKVEEVKAEESKRKK